MTYERPTLTEIDARVRADIEATMTDVPIVRRGSVLAALARGLAGASHALHGHVGWVFRQIFPDTADPAQLERQAGFYGLGRAEPAPATGAAAITGTAGAILPAGALLGSEDGLEFRVTAAATIGGGGAAEAPVEAAADGAAGNLSAGARLVLLAPVAGIEGEAEVAAPGLAGGADAESDARLLDRLLLRLRRPPHGGAAHDYVQWALEVPGVTRVWPVSESVGAVTVRFAVDGAPHGPAPNSGEIAAVQAYIDARRPVTAEVTALAPVLLPVDVTLSVTPDTTAVRAAVVAGLEALFAREGAPGATILLSHVREAVSLSIGETDHVVAAPAADVEPGPGEMPVLGTVTFT